ncbi:MAG: c-type cytochrome [Acidobacteriota bacterium]
MAKPNEEFAYNIPRLNIWFAISSVLLAAGVVWLVLDDYTRDWKTFQREFTRREYERTQEALAGSLSEEERAKIAALEAEVQAVSTRLQDNQAIIGEIKSEISPLDARHYRADQDYRFAKSLYDSHRYETEDRALRLREGAAHEGRDLNEHELAAIAEDERALQDELARLEELRQIVLDVEEKRSVAQKRLEEYTGQQEEIEAQISELRSDQTLLERKLERVEPSFVNNFFRNLPILDMLNPSIKINQLVLDNMEVSLNFTKVPRVDRCTTCHLAIDRKGYEGEPQPFVSHPRLDLYLSGSSPHPMESFGCTVCHLGRDRGTSFVNTAHTPLDEAQAAVWRQTYGWRKMKHWEAPMLAGQNVYASCYQCHEQEVEVLDAAPLQRGVTLIENLGCHGCHKIQGFEGLPKAGPDLSRMASKLDRDWTFRWVRSPREFRPVTRMPHFFGLGNNSSPEDVARTDVEIDAMVGYLYQNSQAFEPISGPARGNPRRGLQVIESVGCLGCHRLADHPQPTRDNWHRRTFGPELSGLGSKTTYEWLYSWLKNPKHYWSETRMPSLRLNDQEAADTAAYLASLRATGFDAAPVPELDTELLDEIMLGFLIARLPEASARAELAGMSLSERQSYLGRRMIQRYGCFGCHNIPGFENSLGIGTELTEWASKLLHRLDFGYAHIEHSKPAWMYQKLMDPRSYDEGKIKKPDEKLKMPHFGLSPDQARDIVTAVMGFSKQTLPMQSVRQLDAREQAVEAGRRYVKNHNCQGCHIVEGRGGDIVEIIARMEERSIEEARALGPPPLNGEGKKVQPRWLFEFLRQPSPIRPWLEVRMPTFAFEEETATTVVRYFSAVDRASFPFEWRTEGPQPPIELVSARKLASSEYLDCFSCHQQGDRKPQGPPEGWAPDLVLASQRLRYDWVKEWLKDPQKLQPGTRMPTYFADEYSGPDDILAGDEEEQIRILTEYTMSLGRRTTTGGSGQAR